MGRASKSVRLRRMCASTPKFPQFVNRQCPAGNPLRMGEALPPVGPPGWG
jgi:hypothetical protein